MTNQHAVGSGAERRRMMEVEVEAGRGPTTFDVSKPLASEIVIEATSPGLRSGRVSIAVTTDQSAGVMEVASQPSKPFFG